MFSSKSALLLDMNNTFMFGEDRFGNSEDFSKYYHEIGGGLSKPEINTIILSVYDYLNEIYPSEKYRHNFPSIENTIKMFSAHDLSEDELSKIVDTFACHEIGDIPEDYVEVLHKLNKKFQLALIVDIWSPKTRWCNLFNELDIYKLFSASSFSSDHGMVKPSPKPFEMLINQLRIDKHKALVIGDSIRRDLGGAMLADIDCVLVGGAKDPRAVKCYDSLIAFSREL